MPTEQSSALKMDRVQEVSHKVGSKERKRELGDFLAICTAPLCIPNHAPLHFLSQHLLYVQQVDYKLRENHQSVDGIIVIVLWECLSIHVIIRS